MSLKAFQDFDAAALAEGNDGPPKDFVESSHRLSRLISKLPQRAVIQDHHATRWLKRTFDMAILRMELEHGEGNATIEDVHNHVLWHIRRASAIGGSEIGTVVTHFRGETGGFSNARNLVLEKLLIMSPQLGDDAMNRGVRAEPWIQKMFMKKYDAVSDQAALEVLKGFRWDKAPYIVGTPDDLVTYPSGRREIVDYKCPSADVNAEYERKGEVSFDYFCQVHQYGIFSRLAGIKFDGMAISCFDPRSFDLVPYQIELDAALVKEMLSGAKTLWNDFVMMATVPEVPGLGQLNFEDPETKTMMDTIVMEASVLKVLEDQIKNLKAMTLERVSAVGTEAHANNEGKINLGFATFERKRSWDEDILASLATAAGVEIEDFKNSTGKFDPEAGEVMIKKILAALEAEDPDALRACVADIADAGGVPQKKALDVDALRAELEKIGVDTSSAAGIAEKFSLSRAGAQAESIKRIKDQAQELTDILEEVVSKQAGVLLAPPVELEDDGMEMQG